jgi:hypothetical protein
MFGTAWSWNSQEHSDVARVLAGPVTDRDQWCDKLETAPQDAVVGKVLCVCAASAIARAVLSGGSAPDPEAERALELLDCWIDDPTEERFERICSLLFGDETPELGAEGVVSGALRTATSSVGNYEAGWALSGTCESAARSGLNNEQLRTIAAHAVLSRRIAH